MQGMFQQLMQAVGKIGVDMEKMNERMDSMSKQMELMNGQIDLMGQVIFSTKPQLNLQGIHTFLSGFRQYPEQIKAITTLRSGR